jgi:hypothetical protein
MTNEQKQRLIAHAQGILKAERHWSTRDAADQAENGADLAEALLVALGVPAEHCPNGCQECKEHRENVGEDPDEEEAA